MKNFRIYWFWSSPHWAEDGEMFTGRVPYCDEKSLRDACASNDFSDEKENLIIEPWDESDIPYGGERPEHEMRQGMVFDRREVMELE